MPTFEKISISLERELVSWLRDRAAERGMSVSALASEALVKERQCAERVAYAREVGMETPTPEQLHTELLAILGYDDMKPVVDVPSASISEASVPQAELRKRA